MFDPILQKSTRGSLIINTENQLAFFYSAELPFVPQWASIDVERGEIYIGTRADDDESEGLAIKLGEINAQIYEKVMSEKKILLVHMENGDIRTPDMAIWVPLTIAHQHSTV